MSHNRSTAFLGSQQLKQETIDQVTRLLEERKIIISRTPRWDADTGTGSPFGALLKNTDYSALETTLGMSPDTATLYELVSSCCILYEYKGESQVSTYTPETAPTQFLHWLEVIQPGADLSDLHARFAAAILEGLANVNNPLAPALPEKLRTVLLDIAQLHRKPDTTASEWRQVRRQAVEITDESEGSAKLVSHFAETISWPADEVADELRAAIASLVYSLRWEASLSVFSEEELNLQQEAEQAIDRFTEAGNVLTAESLEKIPEVEVCRKRIPPERNIQSLARSNSVGEQAAEFLHDLLVQATRG